MVVVSGGSAAADHDHTGHHRHVGRGGGFGGTFRRYARSAMALVGLGGAGRRSAAASAAATGGTPGGLLRCPSRQRQRQRHILLLLAVAAALSLILVAGVVVPHFTFARRRSTADHNPGRAAAALATLTSEPPIESAPPVVKKTSPTTSPAPAPCPRYGEWLADAVDVPIPGASEIAAAASSARGAICFLDPPDLGAAAIAVALAPRTSPIYIVTPSQPRGVLLRLLLTRNRCVAAGGNSKEDKKGGGLGLAKHVEDPGALSLLGCDVTFVGSPAHWHSMRDTGFANFTRRYVVFTSAIPPGHAAFVGSSSGAVANNNNRGSQRHDDEAAADEGQGQWNMAHLRDLLHRDVATRPYWSSNRWLLWPASTGGSTGNSETVIVMAAAYAIGNIAVDSGGRYVVDQTMRRPIDDADEEDQAAGVIPAGHSTADNGDPDLFGYMVEDPASVEEFLHEAPSRYGNFSSPDNLLSQYVKDTDTAAQMKTIAMRRARGNAVRQRAVVRVFERAAIERNAAFRTRLGVLQQRRGLDVHDAEVDPAVAAANANAPRGAQHQGLVRNGRDVDTSVASVVEAYRTLAIAEFDTGLANATGGCTNPRSILVGDIGCRAPALAAVTAVAREAGPVDATPEKRLRFGRLIRTDGLPAQLLSAAYSAVKMDDTACVTLCSQTILRAALEAPVAVTDTAAHASEIRNRRRSLVIDRMAAAYRAASPVDGLFMESVQRHTEIGIIGCQAPYIVAIAIAAAQRTAASGTLAATGDVSPFRPRAGVAAAALTEPIHSFVVDADRCDLSSLGRGSPPLLAPVVVSEMPASITMVVLEARHARSVFAAAASSSTAPVPIPEALKEVWFVGPHALPDAVLGGLLKAGFAPVYSDSHAVLWQDADQTV